MSGREPEIFENESCEPEEMDRESEAGRRGLPMNCLRICVDRYNKEIEGRIYSKLSREELTFRSLGELLLRADVLFDEKGYPQSFQEKRSFVGHTAWNNRYAFPKALLTDEEILSKKGTYCTFDILVYSRRQASWQGAIMEQDGPGRSFQSAKELLELIMEEVRDLKRN